VHVGDVAPHTLGPKALLHAIGLVPQDAADLLYAATIALECAAADADAQAVPGTCAALLSEIAPELSGEQTPRDLSEGQRLSVVLAIVMTAAPNVLLLDEPTRGLDYRAKERLASVLRRFAQAGTTIIIATHDVELTADLASRMIVLADGDVVVDGDTADVAVSSPAFAPQIAKVVAPLPWLTVGDVAESLGVLP
jgi:energy-coupling factor transport system ATP-binding protein